MVVAGRRCRKKRSKTLGVVQKLLICCKFARDEDFIFFDKVSFV
jgi:hypothetical protein